MESYIIRLLNKRQSRRYVYCPNFIQKAQLKELKTMIRDIIDANQTVPPNQKELDILHENFPSCFHSDGSFDLSRFSEFLKDKVNVTKEGYELKFLKTKS